MPDAKIILGVGLIAGFVLFLFNLDETTETVQPAIEIVQTAAQMPNSTDAVLACSLVLNVGLRQVAEAGTNPLQQLRVDPESPFFDCTTKFCALPRPEGSSATLVYDKYCAAP